MTNGRAGSAYRALSLSFSDNFCTVLPAPAAFFQWRHLNHTHIYITLHLFALYLDYIPAFRSLIPRSFVVMYADDILLIAPSCGELQLLFQVCESELDSLDKSINETHMLHSYPLTSSGHSLPWTNEIRYLGVYVIAGRQFRCSTTYAKRSFHRSINAILGNVGRIASED